MSGPLRRALSVVAALLPPLALSLGIAGPVSAQVPIIATGSHGSVSLLNFDGGPEAQPESSSDVGQASVECDSTARGRRVVFAGARAWASDLTAGLHNDWQYVRVTAGAVDPEGSTRKGEVSPYYPAYDDQPATLPAVGVYLPDDGEAYTPVLVVEFFDATYRPTGTAVVASQSGARRVSLTPGLGRYLGDYWYVAADDLVRCD